MNLIFKDIIDGWRHSYIWRALAWSDIMQRYKRTRIGPLWGVITTGVVILFIGPIYSRLFGQNLSEYFPYVAISYVLWNFFATLILEGANSLIASTEFIKHVAWPFSVYFYRCL